MPKINKSTGGGGAWLDKKTLATGDRLKLETEADWIPSQQGGEQLVAKCRVQGKTQEAVNIAINAPTRNGLIDAFGDDSALWVEKPLTVHKFDTLIAGKKGIAIYLVPEGYELGEDSGGFLKIMPGGTQDGAVDAPKEEEINPDDIPF